MAIFVDIFMAACLLLALVLGVRQGFLQSLARVAIVIVALLGAAWLAEHLADPAAKWLEPMLTEKIQQQMDGQAAAADDPSLAAAGLLETFGFSGDALDKLVESATEKAQEVGQTLLSAVDVTAGLKKEGAIVINSSKSPAELRPLLKGYEGRVCTIDAGKISEEELGKNFPNTPMLAAIVRVSGVIGEEEFIKDMEGSFKHKFASKPQVIEGNMRALKRSLEEVQVG